MTPPEISRNLDDLHKAGKLGPYFLENQSGGKPAKLMLKVWGYTHLYALKWYFKDRGGEWHQFGIVHRINQPILGLAAVRLQTDWLRDMQRYNRVFHFLDTFLPWERGRRFLMKQYQRLLFRMPKRYKTKLK